MAQPPAPDLTSLDARAREIFREIVESYLTTGEPVGSRTLSKLGGMGLSAASIRNTMADLASLGLLQAPHAMAGRLPTQVGLRFFVDSLLQLGDVPPDEKREIEARIAQAGSNPQDVLGAASDLLSGLAGGAGLVVTPQRDAPVRHAEIVGIGPGQALLVLVFEDNQIENRVITTPPEMPPGALAEAANYLNARFKGRTLNEARVAAAEALQRDRAELDAAAAKLVESGLVEWSGEDPMLGRSLIVRGRGNLLKDQQAIADLERARQLFDDLEKTRELIQVLDLAKSAETVRVFIGSENPLFSLSGSSLIVAPYMNAERKVVGALGVIGPTRLNYARVIPVVDYTARVVGRVLDGRGGER
ncbi:MAG TPA: heat-inducible transcriptional repressor HrcA [Vitreimonas sp.]|uniref:heat-inducible transcriptional repressor HrcA n=1 Tax=Vitreimonas sp. TaxID=3069702 RepID=UPI002D4EC7D7|nr:heat-inducible transcriptional repressor HrcA [Vitreimonas sp.]HYD89611.1 heat-inducible transcriptional repressor HrcA [Vitreimonas sp.]